MEIQIRRASPEDFDELGDVMFDAVHAPDSLYSKAQQEAWVPVPRRGDAWVQRLNDQAVFLAEDTVRVVGFVSLMNDGYIDFAYVKPAYQGCGIFRRLYCRLESLALSKNIQRLWVHVSLNAEAAFRAVGFTVQGKEKVKIETQWLERFEMEKQLTFAGQQVEKEKC